MKNNIKWLTTTSMYVALIICAQMVVASLPLTAISLGPIKLSQLITGSLVNMFLFIAVIKTGALSGVSAGIISAFVAAFFGINLPLPQMVPLVAFGNTTLALVASRFVPKGTSSLNARNVSFILIPSAIKCIVLWVGVTYVIVPFFSTNPAISKAISIAFSYPQLITAIIGGFISLKIYTRLSRF